MEVLFLFLVLALGLLGGSLQIFIGMSLGEYAVLNEERKEDSPNE